MSDNPAASLSSQSFLCYAAVLLELNVDKLFDFGVPAEIASKAKRGMRVEVPIRGKPCFGYIFAIKEKSEHPRVSPITRLLGEEELITPELFELGLWMSRYYCSPLYKIFKVLLPASIRRETQPKQQLFVMRNKTREELKELCEKIRQTHPAQALVLDVMLKVKKGILLTELLEETEGSRAPVDTLAKKGYLLLDIVRVDRSPLINEEYFPTKPKTLNPEQASSLEKICSSLKEGRFETHLIHGVTGSGKTEVYLQAIEEAQRQGKGTIMLVPEIALTAQTIERFRSRFSQPIAILHHRLSHGERLDEWQRIQRGEARIAIGARSAIFCPMHSLGLIIVDEEHEGSYKQNEEMPCYQARDVAVMRGKLINATILLGSATPSLESYYNASVNKYTLSTLNSRADSALLPQVRIVDMRHEFSKAQGFTHFSDALIQGIKTRQASGEQTILFLNRRGYHSSMLCLKCQTPIRCHHCDVSLTFHLGDNQLACHLCGYHRPLPSCCPTCKTEAPLKFRGAGTENVEKALHALFPEIRTIRMDADTTRHKGSHQRLLREFGSGKADVLIGTQMIAKGLHFPAVTLVGVLNSDSSLNIPDFRASETVFQLITQVAGRAGRGALPGEVIIQTCMPDNTTLQLAAKQDYLGFYQAEIAVRECFNYPPFVSMAKVCFSGTEEKVVFSSAETVWQALRRHLTQEFELHPVVAAGYTKVKDHYRFQFLVRGPSISPFNRAFTTVQSHIQLPKTVKMMVDINPSSTYF